MSDSKAKQIVALIGKLFPNDSVRSVLAGPVAKEALGELPAYSGRSDYHISPTTTVNCGAFILAYGTDETQRDPASGRMGAPVILLIERSEKDEAGSPRIGVPGGYVDLDAQESPAAGAVRELGEEIVNSSGEAILTIAPDRLEPVVAGIDYRGNFGNAVSYTGFKVELSQQELKALRTHATRLSNDPVYASAVMEASHGEVGKIALMGVNEMPALKTSRFMHPHECDALQKLAASLRATPPHIAR